MLNYCDLRYINWKGHLKFIIDTFNIENSSLAKLGLHEGWMIVTIADM